MGSVSSNQRIGIVTGASTGIGRAIAIAFARCNISVGLVGRNQQALSETKKLVDAVGGNGRVFIADLRKLESINALVQDIRKSYGAVDILANVAGVWHDQEKAFYGPHLDELPVSQINDVIDVNIRATMLLTGSLIPLIKTRKHGKIINISGTFSNGGAGWLHYYVTKLAVESFTKGLSDELKEFNIQVNCISPSDVATHALEKYFPEQIEFALNPDDVAKLAVFLTCSEVANSISGQIIVIKK